MLRVPRAQPAQQERKDCPDRTVSRERTEIRESQENEDHRELPEVQEIQEHAERSDNRDVQDKREKRALPELKEMRVWTELSLVTWDSKENPVSQETTVQSDSKVQPGDQENPD